MVVQTIDDVTNISTITSLDLYFPYSDVTFYLLTVLNVLIIARFLCNLLGHLWLGI